MKTRRGSTTAKRFQPLCKFRQPPGDEHNRRRREEIAPRIFQSRGNMMKPRQMHQRLVQPNLGAAVVEELPDVELYDEDEPNQPREKTERNAARARSGPGDNPQHRMPQAR